eukprot:CAMPEP_0172802712 /NCGR_PEP_ID=MMETSP1075-20121228/4052_1 /TAXON_ID=2916 /ORGANISM="Ceratium fusus, Strain PA161109" /LENGTH=91 /DNA_ID=CAMNT_0013641025 /DNA_START=847 /DNA_END=1122 /DNA_ORIENTATION=-
MPAPVIAVMAGDMLGVMPGMPGMPDMPGMPGMPPGPPGGPAPGPLGGPPGFPGALWLSFCAKSASNCSSAEGPSASPKSPPENVLERLGSR